MHDSARCKDNDICVWSLADKVKGETLLMLKVTGQIQLFLIKVTQKST